MTLKKTTLAALALTIPLSFAITSSADAAMHHMTKKQMMMHKKMMMKKKMMMHKKM